MKGDYYMILTDIPVTCDGIKSVMSFDNHKQLYDYMIANNIVSCRSCATLASLNITGYITVTPNDIKKILESGD
jgi:hypothetical protein